MSRTLPTRLLTGLWAIWFGALLVEPAALHSCLMHGAHASRLMHGQSSAGHDMADHMSPGVTHASHSQTGRHAPSSNPPCTCLGMCCCAPTAIVPTHAVAELPARRVAAVRTPELLESRDLRLGTPDYAHPFANGPPSRV